jgi:hypothetical protein
MKGYFKEIYNVILYWKEIVLDERRGNCILKFWLICCELIVELVV